MTDLLSTRHCKPVTVIHGQSIKRMEGRESKHCGMQRHKGSKIACLFFQGGDNPCETI